MTEEEFVRAHWGAIDSACIFAGTDGPCVIQYLGNWNRAAEFTRERLEQIRQLREEIARIDEDAVREEVTVLAAINKYAWAQPGDHLPCLISKIRDLCVARRTAERLNSILADLQRGMKSPELVKDEREGHESR